MMMMVMMIIMMMIMMIKMNILTGGRDDSPDPNTSDPAIFRVPAGLRKGFM
jgi:zona occludens toxin (predicted ATPase)